MDKNPTKLPWLDRYGNFKLRTCITAQKYIAHYTKLPLDSIEVHKTSSFLIVTAVKDGKMMVNKVRAPSAVYMVYQCQLDDVIEAIRTGVVVKTQTHDEWFSDPRHDVELKNQRENMERRGYDANSC